MVSYEFDMNLINVFVVENTIGSILKLLTS